MASKNYAEYFVGNGFLEDCNKLMDQFEKADSVRFQEFSRIWLDMKFSLIFTGRESYAELLEFCEEVLRIAKLFVLPPYRFKTRIGGLYLLYGLYYKKPIESVKIRMVSQEWKYIQELHDYVKQGEHTDANYILCKLILDDAFWHCAFDREYGLEKCFRAKENKQVNHYTVMPAIKDMAEQGQLLTKIDSLSKAYHKAKCAFSNGEQPSRGLNLYDQSIGEEIIAKASQGTSQIGSKLISEKYKEHGNPSRSKYMNNKTAHMKWTVDKVRPKQGHGFDTESSEDESLPVWSTEDFNPNLPDTFDVPTNSSDLNSKDW